MKKESALNYFEALSKADSQFPKSDTAISVTLYDDEYGVAVAGPPEADGDVFSEFLNDLLEEGYDVTVSAEHIDGITNLVVSFA